ncbi:MAG TPA: hypothetical protein VKQ54_13320, partial [Caulobacteraceae bacterium]|nr:hypothetical protein [Caulobacteraceae bacterium]
ALVGPRPAAEAGLRYARDVAAIAEPALVQALFGGRILNVVTTDWGRFDISFVEGSELVRYDAERLTPLFNRGERSPPRGGAAPYRPSPETVLRLANEYLRVLGLLVGALGREEYGLGLNGIDILRRITVDLMLEENAVGPADRGGALRRNPLLTADQRRNLAALAPVVADHDGLIAANAALSAIFLPRARRLAAQVGAPWPTVFEEATRRHLRERAGVTIPGL